MGAADCRANSVRKPDEVALNGAKSRPNECKMSTRLTCPLSAPCRFFAAAIPAIAQRAKRMHRCKQYWNEQFDTDIEVQEPTLSGTLKLSLDENQTHAVAGIRVHAKQSTRKALTTGTATHAPTSIHGR